MRKQTMEALLESSYVTESGTGKKGHVKVTIEADNEVADALFNRTVTRIVEGFERFNSTPARRERFVSYTDVPVELPAPEKPKKAKVPVEV